MGGTCKRGQFANGWNSIYHDSIYHKVSFISHKVSFIGHKVSFISHKVSFISKTVLVSKV